MPLIAISVLVIVAFTAFYFWQMRMPRDTTIPPVVGLNQAEAVRELRRFHLSPKVLPATQTSEKISPGSVITADPSSGRRVKAGRTVSLVISAGSSYTNVPDVRELGQAEARERLKDAGLTVATEEYQFHQAIPFDRIIDVSPRPGTRVKRKSQVALMISKGEPEQRTRRSRQDNDMRASLLSVELPTDSKDPQDVRIEVNDVDGQRTVYQQAHAPGDTVVYNVQGFGDTTVEVYYGTRLLLTRKL